MTYQELRVLFTKRFHIPKIRYAEKALRQFTLAEKAVFFFLTVVFVLSAVILLFRVNNSFLVDVPLRGGTLTEGIIGNPRFINPVLAISEADKNLVSLVYSGLLRFDKSGKLTEDLAESVTVSGDGLTYTAKLKPGAVFHDGAGITADDIVFTVGKILDPGIKSPLYGDFVGVTVNKIDSSTVTFSLKRPYAPFINNLTVGILPKHVWSSVTDDEFSFSQWNVLPIGSGPYKVDNVTRDNGGIPNYYDLTPFDESVAGSPYIAHYVFKFFPSEADLLDAYDGGDIESLSGISPDEALILKKKGARILSAPLPRVFGVFFNQNSNSALLDKTVRQALDMSAPKQEIVDHVLDGYATPISGPLPPGLFASINDAALPKTRAERLAAASALLEKNGWTKNSETGILEKKSKKDTLKLSLSLATSDNPELRAVADMLKADWSELGADVRVTIYDQGDLNQNVIRPRRYDALLFGEVVGKDADVYPFWHSSERNDPGLNIALYANSQVDKLLTDARAESDPAKREMLYQAFDTAVRADVPAVFLYSPNFLYVVPKTVNGVALGELGSPQDRFRDARNWYIETNSVWNIFVKN
ncbi:hypothetical protein KW796_01400 [Candidatus Parcubacteria bacterium]|nr:hypothetical protein [Candidatus Parcubacteria bacterium]